MINEAKESSKNQEATELSPLLLLEFTMKNNNLNNNLYHICDIRK